MLESSSRRDNCFNVMLLMDFGVGCRIKIPNQQGAHIFTSLDDHVTALIGFFYGVVIKHVNNVYSLI